MSIQPGVETSGLFSWVPAGTGDGRGNRGWTRMNADGGLKE